MKTTGVLGADAGWSVVAMMSSFVCQVLDRTFVLAE